MPMRRWTAANCLLLATVGASAALSDSEGDKNLSCAPRVVCLAARLLGREVRDCEIREAFGARVSGEHSYEEITDALNRLGLKSRFARLDPTSPGLPRTPVIAAVKASRDSPCADHFVVLYGSKNENGQEAIQVLDFPYPPRFIPFWAFSRRWDGSALHVAATEEELPVQSIGESPWVTGVLAGSATLVLLASLTVFRCAHKMRTP